MKNIVTKDDNNYINNFFKNIFTTIYSNNLLTLKIFSLLKKKLIYLNKLSQTEAKSDKNCTNIIITTLDLIQSYCV